MMRTTGALFAIGIAVCACAHAPRGQPLLDAVRTYNDGVRWERFTAAAAVVPVGERDTFLDEREALADDLRITDYELVRVNERGESADVQVKLTWYRDSEGTVRETWSRQRWERRGKAWRLVEEAKARGADMPGLDSLPSPGQPR